MPKLTDPEIAERLTERAAAGRATATRSVASSPARRSPTPSPSSSASASTPKPPITIPTSPCTTSRVTLTFWTHSEGGLTAKDFAGAAAADAIAPR